VKLGVVVVFGVGYVLGTRAGRERYDQIVAMSNRLADRLEERAGPRPHALSGDREG